MPDTQGGSDATGQAHVAMHPMDEVLKHQLAAGVDLVIPVGDLTDKGSAVEWEEWTSVARPYKEQGMEFLPVMGNHELNYSYTTGWINAMREFIPEDAVHMPGYEWVNYYVIRENVLMIGLAYYNLPLAIKWIEQVVEENRADVDHIVVASHDGLIGAKYGQTREQIVEGTKDDDWVYSVADEIRAFFSEHDVIYMQGHEHQYQRSLIARDTAQTSFPSGSTPEGGNYRMNTYTQILSGNASYKGYEFRYGERELVQMIVSQKNATMSKGSDHFDVNSSVLAFEIAARSAFREGIAKANPILLEPIMRVEVVTPEDYMGDVIGDLNSRRGQVQEMNTRGNANVINAMVPLANMFGYVNNLRSLTQGRANYSMQFDHYEQVPSNVAEEVKAKLA